MKLTQEQINTIRAYTDNRYIDQDKLIAYLEKNRIIESKVFEYSSRYENKKRRALHDFEEEGYDISLATSSYKPVDRETFIRRIPFYFYIPNGKGYGKRIAHIAPSGRAAEDLETFYRDLELLYYDFGMPMEVIFSYPTNQANTPYRERENESPLYSAISRSIEFEEGYNSHKMFPQWVEYLKMCRQLRWNDLTPEHFLTAYNFALEAVGKKPIIYKPIQKYSFAFIRNGFSYECEGIFPCDDENTPILRWTNIKVENAGKISFSAEKSWKGTLSIALTPTTKIYAQGMTEFTPDENDESIDGDEWYPIYLGPMTMSFDNEALRNARESAGLTQKQIADAIGVSDRTYQKWEYGETTPDGHHLLRIMNWLEIDDVQYLTKYVEPK